MPFWGHNDAASRAWGVKIMLRPPVPPLVIPITIAEQLDVERRGPRYVVPDYDTLARFTHSVNDDISHRFGVSIERVWLGARGATQHCYITLRNPGWRHTVQVTRSGKPIQMRDIEAAIMRQVRIAAKTGILR